MFVFRDLKLELALTNKTPYSRYAKTFEQHTIRLNLYRLSKYAIGIISFSANLRRLKHRL